MPTILPTGDITIAEAMMLSQRNDLELSLEAIHRISGCRDYLESKLEEDNGTYYGINTGFGALERVRIAEDKIEQLQLNLVRSHACGTGNPVQGEIVRLMMLLKVIALSKGHSGVRVEVVQRLLDFLNNEVIPLVFEQGSLGASGDLAPLAHMSLPIIGEGHVLFEDDVREAGEVLDELELEPIHLKAKEGLALLNGTQFMTAYACTVIMAAEAMIAKANLVAAASLDAFGCRLEPFDELVHKVRPHEGQVEVASGIRNILTGSALSAQPKTQTQDPYSFRCIPQVHGASRDALVHAMMVIETEINSVTDNPLIFPDQDKIISGGNFHGQPLALALDYLAIAIAEIGSISERRTYHLLSGKRGLPDFLAKDPGLESGLMIAQYTAAALVAENRKNCTPASVDNAITSQGQEDHVSMGAMAAVKCLNTLAHTETILGIELICAAEALEHRRPARSSEQVELLVRKLRDEVPALDGDRSLRDAIEKAALLPIPDSQDI